MPDFNIWSSFLKDEILIYPDTNNGIDLIEPKVKTSKVRIGEIPKDSFAIKLDECLRAYDIFRSNYNEAKMADYAIISIYKDKIVVFVIELKNSNGKKVSFKMIASKCLIYYIYDVIKSFVGEKLCTRKIDIRYIAFYETNISIDKRPTAPQQVKESKLPNGFWIIKNVKRFSFSKLLNINEN